MSRLKFGDLQRKEVTIETKKYELDYKFEKEMGWVDNTIDIVSCILLEHKEIGDYDVIREKYIVIYRKILNN